MSSNRLEKLVAEVERHFAPTKSVDVIQLVVDRDWETDSLRRELGKLDLLDRVPDGFVARFFNSLPAFTTAGLHVVFGSYLSFSIRYLDSDAAEYVTFALTDMSPSNRSSYYDGFHAELTLEQKQVIGLVYTELIESEPGYLTPERKLALAGWNQVNES